MHTKKPKVSIVMPAYNAEKYISAAIDSILDQTFRDFEFIIIDDASNDSTWKIISDYKKRDGRIIPLRNKTNLKICRTLNKGISKAKGLYVMRMDADDWSYPRRLAKMVRFLDSHNDYVMVGSAIDVCNDRLTFQYVREYPTADLNIRSLLKRYSPFCHAAVMYRRTCVIDAGLYNPQLVYSEDYDLYFRLANIGKLANIAESLLRVRFHAGSSTSQHIGQQARLTFYIKLKAAYEYGFKMNVVDKLHLLLHLFGVFIIPKSMMLFIFTVYRKITFRQFNRL